MTALTDRIAEALLDAVKFKSVIERQCVGDNAQRMAERIEAELDLTEEAKHLADGAGGIATNWKTGETTVYSKPCTKVTRLVSPWVKEQR